MIVTEGFLICSLLTDEDEEAEDELTAGAPLTMVTPGDWDCCMGLPFTGEADFPWCAGRFRATGTVTAVESVADLLPWDATAAEEEEEGGECEALATLLTVL